MFGLQHCIVQQAFRLTQLQVNTSLRKSLASFLSWQLGKPSRSASISTLPTNTPVYHAVHGSRYAITDRFQLYSYKELFCWGRNVADAVQLLVNPSACSAPHVAVMCGNNAGFVACQWGLWSLGCTMVPLFHHHPLALLEYFLVNSEAELIISDEENYARLQPLAEKLNCHLVLLPKQPQVVTEVFDPSTLPSFDWNSRTAMLFYTSGTTGSPKGVPLTHGNLHANVHAMSSAWKISQDDIVLHCLPLHHVHGVINALTLPLAVGGRVDMLAQFDAKTVWEKLLGVSFSNLSSCAKRPVDAPTVFMAVPTMYAKLIQWVDRFSLPEDMLARLRERCKSMRLMISGSAPLPDPILTRWETLTGHRLLERYGMTEIGMCLTNPLDGDRIVGAVGHPLPSVSVRIVSPDTNKVIVEGTSDSTLVVTPGQVGQQGELQVKGPAVFSRYWRNPEATTKSFTDDGWFLTGDIAVFDGKTYRVVGRSSVDIIKSGGYKISALDVERCLLSHPLITDCAVVGVADDIWGQRVAAVVAFTAGQENPTLDDVRSFAKDTLPSYSLPSLMKVVEQIPRNAMGKVDKKQLVRTTFTQTNTAK